MARRVQQDRSVDHAVVQRAAIAPGDDRRDHLPQDALDSEATAVPMGREPARTVPSGAVMDVISTDAAKERFTTPGRNIAMRYWKLLLVTFAVALQTSADR